jgi:hypothetical protein
VNRRVLTIALATLAILLVLGGPATALADSYGSLTGAIYFVAGWEGEDWHVWQVYNVFETEPWVDEQGVTHNAKGQVNYWIYNEGLGWRYVRTKAVCVAFGEEPDGRRTATVVLQLRKIRGWGWGEPGEHSKFYLRNGIEPGREGDQWNMEYYQVDPEWIEFWPADAFPPACGCPIPGNMDVWWDLSGGNLTIH